MYSYSYQKIKCAQSVVCCQFNLVGAVAALSFLPLGHRNAEHVLNMGQSKLQEVET